MTGAQGQNIEEHLSPDELEFLKVVRSLGSEDRQTLLRVLLELNAGGSRAQAAKARMRNTVGAA